MKSGNHPKGKVNECLTGAAVLGAVALLGSTVLSDQGLGDLAPFPNASGVLQTVSVTGSIDRQNPFFKPLGSTGTTCEDCHFAADGWSVSAEHLRALFEQTNGLHPVFRPHASNNLAAAAALPANATIEQRRAVYSLMLNKGDALVRVQLRLPTDPTTPAEFALVGVDDPSVPLNKVVIPDGTGSTMQVGDPAQYLTLTGGFLWVHRHPLPTANFKFLTATSWEERTTPTPNPVTGTPVDAGIFTVSRDTTRFRLAPDGVAPDGHTYTDAELNALVQQMVNFQKSIFVAQSTDNGAGRLDAGGARGGPEQLMNEPFSFGINDFLQGDLMLDTAGAVHLTGKPFTPRVFDSYDAWQTSNEPQQAAIARGQRLFNSVRLNIGGVGGLNDSKVSLPSGEMIDGPAGVIRGSCGSCHDTPNVGNHSTRLPLNIGIADKAPAFFGSPGVADLPLFTLRNNATGAIVQTTDPGRAIRSGRWADIGQFKTPTLRGLAARAPYFHNGVATSLDDVVGFYDMRFRAGFTPQEQADLVAFLKAT